MNQWSFYEIKTGVFTGRSFSGNSKHLALNTPEGCAAFPGYVDPNVFRYENGVAVKWKPPAPPNTDLVEYEWDESAWSWVAQPTRLSIENEARSIRDNLLTASDWTQIPDVDLSDAEVLSWRTYRQALRNISEQNGFPFTIVWPDPPTAR